MTTVNLEAATDVSKSSVSVTGAGTYPVQLGDASDSTYASPTADGAFTRLGFSTYSVTAGSVVKQLRYKDRGVTDTLGNRIGSVRNASNQEVYSTGYAAQFFASMGTGTFSWAAPSNPLTAGAAFDVLVTFPKSGSGTLYAEMSIDMMYVEPPVTTVTAVSPDPYTASNIIPISWTNSLDSDGGSQTRYHVKVFTDAVYGGGGFDPETSTPVWDSNATLSSTNGPVNTAPLPTGDTYRAYVKVAQTVNGVAHWGAWAFDTFQVSVTTSDVLSVVTAAQNSTARIDVTVNRDTGSSAWDFIEVERSRDAGSTWEDVRGATYVDATPIANSFAVSDYETGNGESVLYRARATRIVSDLPISGSWVQSTPAVAWTSTDVWLKVPTAATKNRTIDVYRPFQPRGYSSRVGVFQVIGRATPVAISDVLGDPAQTLTIDTLTETDSDDLLDVLRETFLLYCPTDCEGTEAVSYLAVTGVSMTPTPDRAIVRRRWTVNVVEVDAPADPLASAP